MKRYILIIVFIFNGITSMACDICGCYMGILPNEQKDYFALYYRYRSFAGKDVPGNSLYPDGNLKTLHGEDGSAHASENAAKSYEIYRVAEMRGRYFIHPRLEVDMILPFIFNSGYNGVQEVTASGLGDVTIMSGYHLVENKSVGKFKQELLAGMGIKLATAKINHTLEGKRISLFSQTGTGSFDFFPYINYLASYNLLGISISASYKVNGTNSYQERIGNSFTNYTSLFYKWNVNDNLLVMPTIQSYYEYTNGLYVNDVLQPGTKMNVLMLGPGVNLYYKHLGLSFVYQVPVSEEVVMNGIESQVRSVLGLTWNFDQTKFIVPAK